MVGSRLPQRVVAAHAMVACERIHDRPVFQRRLDRGAHRSIDVGLQIAADCLQRAIEGGRDLRHEALLQHAFDLGVEALPELLVDAVLEVLRLDARNHFTALHRRSQPVVGVPRCCVRSGCRERWRLRRFGCDRFGCDRFRCGRFGRGGGCFGSGGSAGSDGRRDPIGQRRNRLRVSVASDCLGQRRDGVRIGSGSGGRTPVLVKQRIGAPEHILVG